MNCKFFTKNTSLFISVLLLSFHISVFSTNPEKSEKDNADATSIERNGKSWVLSNQMFSMELVLKDSGIVIKSLYNKTSDYNWVGTGTSVCFGTGIKNDNLKLISDKIEKISNGVSELKIELSGLLSGLKLNLNYKVYPGSRTFSYFGSIKNGGKNKWSVTSLNMLHLNLSAKDPELDIYLGEEYNYDLKKISYDKKSTDRGWIVLENPTKKENMILAHNGGGIPFNCFVKNLGNKIDVYQGVGNITLNNGDRIETNEAYITLASGNTDDLVNEFRHVMKKFVMLKQPDNAPWVNYGTWFTDDNAEEMLYEDIDFAAKLGFDCFQHDASWQEGSSIIPGRNDWGKGLGVYEDSKLKFPHGFKALSQRVHDKGMKFGLWVDPQNVERDLIRTGKIPQSWRVQVDGKDQDWEHPSLSAMTTLCLGNPEYVSSVTQNLLKIIGDWNVDWLKWDPSGTVTEDCNRSDHGHKPNLGQYAYSSNRQKIFATLLEKYPNLMGFECMHNLKLTKVNPAPTYFFPETGNNFMVGPMCGPYVWGTRAYAFGVLDVLDGLYALPADTYYEGSFLDYYFRRIFSTGGLTFGTVSGSFAERLKFAPAGFIEGFKRNIMEFKKIRHLYSGDIYHRIIENNKGWHAVEFCAPDGKEAALMVFRDGGDAKTNKVFFKGLLPDVDYILTSFNDTDGKEKKFKGSVLMKDGFEVKLPDEWLARTDYKTDDMISKKGMEMQMNHGSNVILVKKIE
jgi:hypothetical protein